MRVTNIIFPRISIDSQSKHTHTHKNSQTHQREPTRFGRRLRCRFILFQMLGYRWHQFSGHAAGATTGLFGFPQFHRDWYRRLDLIIYKCKRTTSGQESRLSCVFSRTVRRNRVPTRISPEWILGLQCVFLDNSVRTMCTVCRAFHKLSLLHTWKIIFRSDVCAWPLPRLYACSLLTICNMYTYYSIFISIWKLHMYIIINASNVCCVNVLFVRMITHHLKLDYLTNTTVLFHTQKK